MKHTKDDQKRIDAMNLIGEFVTDNLPPGWRLVIEISDVESSLSLVDPNGIDRDSATSGDICAIRELCESANELKLCNSPDCQRIGKCNAFDAEIECPKYLA